METIETKEINVEQTSEKLYEKQDAHVIVDKKGPTDKKGPGLAIALASAVSIYSATIAKEYTYLFIITTWVFIAAFIYVERRRINCFLCR